MLNDLAKQCYDNAVAKGFYEHEPTTAERIALCHSELSEWLEADRLGRKCEGIVVERLSQMHDQQDQIFQGFYRAFVKGNIEEELADIIIRVLDFCGSKNIDIDAHVKAKMRFNSLREYKHGKKY